MDIDFIIQDIFEFLRPKITLCKDYIEAATLVNSMIELEKQEPIEAEQDEEEADVTPQLEDVLTDDEEDATSDEDSDDSDDSFSEDDSEDEESSSEDYDEDEEEEELDMDFDKEFSRMLLEGRDQRKAAEKKSSTFDASIPLRNRPNIQELSRAQEVTFTLLTKKGQKQQSKQISLPASSTLVVSTLSKQVADLKEKEEMKRIVLDLEKRSRT